jgi:hypothetical protein
VLLAPGSKRGSDGALDVAEHRVDGLEGLNYVLTKYGRTNAAPELARTGTATQLPLYLCRTCVDF